MANRCVHFPLAIMDFVACVFPTWIPSVKCVGYGVSHTGLVVGVKCLVSDSSSRKQWAQRSPRTTSSQPSRTCSRTVRLRSDPLPPKRSRVSVRMLSASHKAYVEIMVWMRSFYRLIYHGIYNPHFCPQSFARTFQKTAERLSSWLTFFPVSRYKKNSHCSLLSLFYSTSLSWFLWPVNFSLDGSNSEHPWLTKGQLKKHFSKQHIFF